MWHNRFSQRLLCITCSHPRCTADVCSTCPICGEPTCNGTTSCTGQRKPLQTYLRPQTKEELKEFLCKNCRHKSSQQCSLCEERKQQTQFPKAGGHRPVYQRSLCFDCCRPRCTAAQCRTCTVCRHPKCTKRTKCQDPIIPLHPKQLLTRKEDLATYLCDRCCYITCACGNVMSLATQKRRKSAGILEKQLYICVDCASRAQWQKDTELGRK